MATTSSPAPAPAATTPAAAVQDVMSGWVRMDVAACGYGNAPVIGAGSNNKTTQMRQTCYAVLTNARFTVYTQQEEDGRKVIAYMPINTIYHVQFDPVNALQYGKFLLVGRRDTYVLHCLPSSDLTKWVTAVQWAKQHMVTLPEDVPEPEEPLCCCVIC